MGTYNHHHYQPLRPVSGPAAPMDLSHDFSNQKTQAPMNWGILGALERATIKYGCYKLELDEIVFKHLPQPWTNPKISGWHGGDFLRTVMKIDAKGGSITLRHTNM
jgi:hypothetical protein